METRSIQTPTEFGFTLLEVTVCMVLVFVTLTISLLPLARVISRERLTYSQMTLINDIRYVQSMAETNCQFGMVRFVTYSPRYTTQIGTTQIAFRTFLPDVNYRDGYLQLGTSHLTYDVRGNAQVAGAIRLVSGTNEADIQMYMGTGLVTPGG